MSPLNGDTFEYIYDAFSPLYPSLIGRRVHCDSAVATASEYFHLRESLHPVLIPALQLISPEQSIRTIGMDCKVYAAFNHQRYTDSPLSDLVRYTYLIVRFVYLFKPIFIYVMAFCYLLIWMLLLCPVAFVTYITVRFLLRTRAIKQLAPVLPFSMTDLKSSFDSFKSENILILSDDKTAHKTLAMERRGVERWAYTFLSRYSKTLRDIGGSLQRLNYPNIHVCYPDITASDHARLQTQQSNKWVNRHSVQECNVPNMMGIMTQVDYHLDIDAIATLKAPIIMITHRFTPGEFVWYEGEATGFATKSTVTMTTRGGTSYSHSYHAWKDEGFVMSENGVVQYTKIGEYGHSTAYLVYPGHGNFSPFDSSRMLPANPKFLQDRFNLDSSRRVVLANGKYTFFVDNHHVGTVSARTIIRTAFSMSTVPRTETYAANLSGMLRGRFTADKQDVELLPHAAILVSQLADKFTLDNGHKFLNLPTAVIGLSLSQRLRYRLLMAIHQHLPERFNSLKDTVIPWLIGKSKSRSLLPWTWDLISCPTYEITPPEVERGRHTDFNRHAKVPLPFRSAGQDNHACPSDPRIGTSSQHPGKPNRFDRQSSTRRPDPGPPSMGRKSRETPSEFTYVQSPLERASQFGSRGSYNFTSNSSPRTDGTEVFKASPTTEQPPPNTGGTKTAHEPDPTMAKPAGEPMAPEYRAKTFY
jgi:hypothetical protein